MFFRLFSKPGQRRAKKPGRSLAPGPQRPSEAAGLPIVSPKKNYRGQFQPRAVQGKGFPEILHLSQRQTAAASTNQAKWGSEPLPKPPFNDFRTKC